MTKVEILNHKNSKLVRFNLLKNGTLLYDEEQNLLLKVPYEQKEFTNVMFFGGDYHGSFGMLEDNDLVTVINEIKVEIIS